MQILRYLLALSLTLGGVVLLLAAVANLYNIDPQPRSLLVGYTVLGLLALFGAWLLARSSRARRDSNGAPAA